MQNAHRKVTFVPLTPLAKRRATIAAVITAVVATVLFVMYAVKLWNDGSTPAPVAGGPGSANEARTFPGEESTGLPSADGSTSSGKGTSSSLSAGDPFANTVGDRKIYDVTVVLESDGAMNAGYRFRDGKADGQQIADKKLTIRSSVRGPLAVAQVAVQVLNNATYATCSIYIDGVKVDSRTARKPGHVTICTG